MDKLDIFTMTKITQLLPLRDALNLTSTCKYFRRNINYLYNADGKRIPFCDFYHEDEYRRTIIAFLCNLNYFNEKEMMYKMLSLSIKYNDVALFNLIFTHIGNVYDSWNLTFGDFNRLSDIIINWSIQYGNISILHYCQNPNSLLNLNFNNILVDSVIYPIQLALLSYPMLYLDLSMKYDQLEPFKSLYFGMHPSHLLVLYPEIQKNARAHNATKIIDFLPI